MMNPDVYKLLEQTGKDWVQKLIERHHEAGQWTTGKTESKFGYKVSSDGLAVFGANYIWNLEFGRKPAKVSYSVIAKWCVNKKIVANMTEPNNVHIISKIHDKIEMFGTYLFRHHETPNGTPSPVLGAITEEDIKELEKKITEMISYKIMFELKIFGV